MITTREYEDAVVAGAREQMKDEDWFKGVCMDRVQEHYPNVQAGVEVVVLDTIYYDAPYWGAAQT